MKTYAIPIENNNHGLDSQVAQHFGRAAGYALVDDNKELITTIENKSEHMGGVGKPPDVLINHKIDILLCSGLGPRAIKRFEDVGIEVYVGAYGTVGETIDLFHKGQLQMATDENACKEHRNGLDEY